MGKRNTFTPCVFVPFRLRRQVPAGALVYDVSSYADHPLCTLETGHWRCKETHRRQWCRWIKWTWRGR
jgi:hypothetical protein